MKKNITLIIMLIIANLLLGQTQKTLVKSFVHPFNDRLLCNLEGSVEVHEWSESYVRVHTIVALQNANTETLKWLIVQGRYQIIPEVIANDLVLSSTSRNIQVKFRNQPLSEAVSYVVYVPRLCDIKVIRETNLHSLLSIERKTP